MSLENSIEKLVTAMNKLESTLAQAIGQSAPQIGTPTKPPSKSKAEPKSQPAKPKRPPVKEPVPEIQETFVDMPEELPPVQEQDVRLAIQQLAALVSPAAAIGVLDTYGVKRIPELDPQYYQHVIDECNRLTSGGTDTAGV